MNDPFAAAESGAEESTPVDDVLLAEEAMLAEEIAEQGVELGTLEQALGEPVCGVSRVDRAVSFSGLTVRFVTPTPYGSACTNAFLTGLASATPRNATVSMLARFASSQAECAQARLRSDYYVNGVRAVAQLSSPGVFRNGACDVGTSYNYDTRRAASSVAGTRALLAGGTPPAAANARFAGQLVHLGQTRQFIWDILPP